MPNNNSVSPMAGRRLEGEVTGDSVCAFFPSSVGPLVWEGSSQRSLMSFLIGSVQGLEARSIH